MTDSNAIELKRSEGCDRVFIGKRTLEVENANHYYERHEFPESVVLKGYMSKDRVRYVPVEAWKDHDDQVAITRSECANERK